MAEEAFEQRRAGGVSRRLLLGGWGVAGIAVAASACTGDADLPGRAAPGSVGVVPDSARTGARDALQHLNQHQALTVEAVAARLIPGDAENPGAREAGVVYYIDHLLAYHTGYPEPAYMQGPFAQTYDGPEPPEGAGDDDDVVWVQAEELERYGRQTPFVPREIYRMGLARLDELSRRRFDGDFVDITEAQQDTLLEAVEDDEADDVEEVFGDLASGDFFDLIREHTLQGMFADPVYGGNRDMVGWRLVGFPGSRRSYSPQDMHDEDYDVAPQSLLDLPPFNADRHEAHHVAHLAVRTRHPNGPID